MKKFYITTAIAYASQKPHIGNCYDHMAADMIARYKRMRGFDVCFLTGTDEHGKKIQDLAAKEGIAPKALADRVTQELQEVLASIGVEYDRFIRTTDAYHEAAVGAAFEQLLRQGDIYKSEYEGMYCTPCESFWTASQLINGKCPDCKREVSPAQEEAYFLRQSKYQAWLEDYYDQHPEFIVPESRKNEMLNSLIRPGLQDLCVTRTVAQLQWGVPVPSDPAHVIYVWIDALLNYATAVGYNAGQNTEEYHKWWPADVHVIGKDICRFHLITWPILLHCLGQPVQKQVFAHPWMLFGESKMSKSLGNVIYADALVKAIGSDATRYYMLAEMPLAVDGTITREAVAKRYNDDLANILGNLVNRSLAMTNKYFGGVVPQPGVPQAQDQELQAVALASTQSFAQAMDAYRLADALEAALALAKRTNKYIDETAPWALAKQQDPRLQTVMYHILESIRMLAGLFAPAMPGAARAILQQLDPQSNAEATLRDIWQSFGTFGGLASGGKVTATPAPLFARLESAETLGVESLA